MTKKTLPEYQITLTQLHSSAISLTPSEMHGLIAGMISGGVLVSDKSWQSLIFDYTNDGMGWPDKALQLANATFEFTVEELTGSGMDMTLLLADSEGDLIEFADSVSEWVNHFISGLGLAGLTLKGAAEDVKEALGDLEEIAKLGIDEEDDLKEQADLLEQVIEHVKACVLTVHAEFGLKPDDKESSPTIH